MKGKILKKVIAAALVLTLVSGGVPVQPIAEYLNPAITASAAEYTQNPTTKDELVPLASSGTVSEAHVVKYANKEWYVIGYDGVGLASESGTMTLFLKGTLGKRTFSDNGSNVYGNSSIHSYLESYLANTENFTSNESGAVVTRVLSGGGSTGNSYSGHVSGDSVNAKLWLLSAAEARKIPQSIIKSGGDGDGWWLRSPGGGSGKANYMPVSPSGNDVPKESGAGIGSSKSIRAAMLLDLNSVIYSSETNTLIAQEAKSHSITVSLDNDQGSVEAPSRADKGETVSFTITTAVGYEVKTVKFNDTPISPLNGVYSFTMPDNDVTISVTFNQIYKVEDHIEQNGDTYTIKTAKGWEVFCDCVKSSAYNGFWNKTVKLGLDITDGVTVSAGIPGKPFFGTFDGDGHTLAVALNSTDEEWVAPFSFFNGSIKNLTVTGTIAGSTYAAGLTGFTYGGSIENVTVSADVSGSSKIGGITGYSDFGSLLVKDTVFNGTLQCNKDVCGLIGWASENVGYNQAITIKNCLFNGTYTCDGEFHPITLRNSNSQFAYTDNGAYYTVDPKLSSNNYIICAGTRVSTINVDDDLTITANPTFTFNNVDYYAEGTTITLSRVGSVTGVSVNNGSVEVTDNQDGTYSFTMPAEDVSINGHFSINIDSTIHHGSVTVTVGTTENAVAANEGDTVTLTVTPKTGYEVGTLTVRDSSNNVIEVNNNQFTMPASDVTVSATFTPDSAHFSQSGDTYTIHDETGWGVFCDFIEGGETFSGKTIILENDIGTNNDPITVTAGKCDPNDSDNDRVFKGVFDGNHKTLTFSTTAADNYVAPFANMNGTESAHASISDLNVKTTITGEDYRHLAGLVAVHTGYVDITNCNADVSISCLKGDNNPSDLYPTGLVSQSSGTLTVNGCTVTGNIATNGKYASGLVGIVQKKAEIKNCLSSVTIKSSTSGDGTHGGLVGVTASNSTTTIEGCVFGGKLLTVGENDTGNCGGILGWKNANVTISNTLYAPAGLESGETEVVAGTGNNPSGTFYRGNAPTLTNCYYTRTLGTAQGKAAHTITAGQDVTVALGGEAANYKNYDVSGISTYGTALAYNGTIYAGNGDSVSLTLGHNTPTGYSTAFTASAGTLENGDLTMPDSNVVISAADTQNDYTITKSAEHGTMTVTVGETQNATTAHYGDTVTLTVTPDEHYQVKSVTVNGGAVAVTDNGNGTYSFTMPDGDVTVSAEFEEQKPITPSMVTLSETNLTYDGTEKTVTVTVKDGDKTLTEGKDYTLTGNIGTVPGRYFVHIEGKGSYTGGYFAEWRINGSCNIQYTINDKTETASAAYGTPYTVTAPQNNTTPFKCWMDGDKVVSYAPTYGFIVHKDMNLTAVYSSEAVENKYVLTMSASKTQYNGNNAIRFIFDRSIDYDAYTIKEVGIRYATNKLLGADTTIDGYSVSVNLTSEDGAKYLNGSVDEALKNGTNVKNYKSTASKWNGTVDYSYAVGTHTDAYVYAIGYVKVMTADNEEKTFYSNIVATSYEKAAQ